MARESSRLRAHSLGILVAVALAALILGLGAGQAFAWTDISDGEWVATYGVTAAEASTVAGGYDDGTFKPGLSVNRSQFAKMVVDGFSLEKSMPTTATFTDVAATDYYFSWIEGSVESGIISGYPDNTFRPSQSVTRQQACSILGLYLSHQELTLKGCIQGKSATYASLNAWYEAEGTAVLAQFADKASIASVHAPAVAYLVYHEITKGSLRSGAPYLSPGSVLTRAQAVTLVLRVKSEDFGSSDSSGDDDAPADGTGGGTPPDSNGDGVPDLPPDGAGGDTPPDGTGSGTPSDGGSSGSATYPTSATYAQSGGTQAVDGQTYTSALDDQSAILVTNGGKFTVANAIITTSGNTSSNDSSSFYGLNAAVVATSASAIEMSSSSITTTGSGANGAFATGEGSSVALTDVTITASGGGGHGVMATLGGSVNLVDVDISTSGANSAPLATDRGSGTITATGGNVVASGQDSPALYSTGTITVTGGTYTASGAEAAVIEGANSIILDGVDLSSTVANKWGVMIYQSMSGDAEGNDGTFTMAGGSLGYSGTTGPLFYVTNSAANINLTGVSVTTGSGVLVEAAAGKWGTSGSNGGRAELIATGQSLTGDVVADTISAVALTLKDNSSLTGSINADNEAGEARLTLSATATWTVAANSYLTSLTLSGGVSGTSITNIIGNGHTVYYDSTDSVNSALGGRTYTLSGGGTLQPLN